MKEKTIKVPPLDCPKCGRSHTYRRQKTGEQVCQHCGHVWIPDENKAKEALRRRIEQK